MTMRYRDHVVGGRVDRQQVNDPVKVVKSFLKPLAEILDVVMVQ